MELRRRLLLLLQCKKLTLPIKSRHKVVDPSSVDQEKERKRENKYDYKWK